MKKYLFLLLLPLGLGITGQAQLLKKIKDKAKMITDQKTDAKANQVIGSGVDSVMDLKSPVRIKKKKKKNEQGEQPADTVNTNPSTSSVSPANTGTHVISYYPEENGAKGIACAFDDKRNKTSGFRSI